MGVADALGDDDLPPAALARVQLQVGFALAVDARGALCPHGFQRAHAAFVAGAPRLDALAYPDFFFGEFFVEACVGFGFGVLHFVAGAQEAAVVAAHIQQAAAVEFPDAVGDFFEKGAVVGDEDDGTAEVVQQVFQPDDGAHVEMVGGLIEQQHVRPRDQHPRQPDAPPPAAGEVGHARRAVQRKALQDVVDAVFQLPAVRGSHLRFQLGEGFAVAVAVVGKQFLVARDQRRCFREAVAHHFAHAARIGGGRVLRQVGDAHAFGQAQFAVIRRLGAAQDVQQGGFAFAVAPQQGDALARLQREIDVIEQRPPAEGERQVLCCQ